MSILTEEQRESVETFERPVIVIASAGTGKTSVLVSRYLKLLEKGFLPEQILCLTFTNDAAAEMKERILAKLPPSNPATIESLKFKSQLGTIHSFCHSLINEFGDEAKLPPITKIREPMEWSTIFETEYERWFQSLPKEEVEFLLRFFSLSEVHDLAYDFFEKRFFLRKLHLSGKFGELFPVFSPLLERLELLRDVGGLYSFDELETETIKLLETNPGIKAGLQKRFRSCLIDEFQDTSLHQWKIIQLLCEREWQKLFAVGDPKQSIYRFRSADITTFFKAKSKLELENAKTVTLSRNFRTEPVLLDSVNAICAQLFTEATYGFQPMQSQVAQSASKAIETLPGSEKDLPGLIQTLPLGETVAVLLRKSEKIAEIQELLEQAGIPASYHKQKSLWSSYDIADLITYFEMLLNPLDDYYFTGFLRGRFGQITNQLLFEVSQLPGDSFFEKARALESIQWVYNLIDEGEFEVGALLQALLLNSSYFPEDRQSFLSFLRLLSDSDTNLNDFVRKLGLLKERGIRLESGVARDHQAAIQIMTVHGSKGLEFDHVFLVDNNRRPPVPQKRYYVSEGMEVGFRYREQGSAVAEPLFEEFYEMEKKAEADESLRVLYVAMTRAKKSLTVLLPEPHEKITKGSWAEIFLS